MTSYSPSFNVVSPSDSVRFTRRRQLFSPSGVLVTPSPVSNITVSDIPTAPPVRRSLFNVEQEEIIVDNNNLLDEVVELDDEEAFDDLSSFFGHGVKNSLPLTKSDRNRNVFNNPFSTLWTYLTRKYIPKLRVPDGIALHSVSRFARGSFTVNSSVVSFGLVTPSISSVFYHFYLDSFGHVVHPFGRLQFENLNSLSLSKVSHFRIVSCGCRFSVFSQLDDTYGFFESIRLSSIGNVEDFQSVIVNYFDGSFSMSDHPSYVSDLLTNISLYEFVLNPSSNVGSLSSVFHAIDSLDENRDLILIRFNGVASLDVLSVSNQERMYESDSPLKRLEISSQLNKKRHYWASLASQQSLSAFLI